MDEPWTLLRVIAMLESGALTPADVANHARSNWRRWEPLVHAFAHFDESVFDRLGDLGGELDHMSLAASTAAASTCSEATNLTDASLQGPLANIPIGVKDMIDVAGMPTTGGSQAYHWIAHEDARAVAHLRAAGAVIVGKTTTQELAFGVVTPGTRNPYHLDHIPGGSSGGSAVAVATGMVLAALGTDTGGSVRIPASCCGVTGFKPTLGRISKDGVMSLSTTFDHVGVIAQTAADVRYMFRLLDEGGAADVQTSIGAAGQTEIRALPHASSDPVRRTGRIAIPRTYVDAAVTDEVRARFDDAVRMFERFGYQIVDFDMEPFTDWKQVQLDIRLPESFAIHREVLESERRNLLQGDLASRLEMGRDVPAATRQVALVERRRRIEVYTERMTGIDAVVMPTLPCSVPRIGQETVQTAGGELPIWDALVYMTSPWNLLGFPAISVPCGLDSQAMPLGLQLIGVPHADYSLLDLAERAQGVLGLPTTRLDQRAAR